MSIETQGESLQPGTPAGEYPLKQPAGVNVSTIGSRIKQAREAARLTQQEVAVKLEVNRASVAQWEIGASKPAQDRLSPLAEFLGVSVQWLAFGEEKATSRNGYTPGVTEDVEAKRRDIVRQIRDLALELDDTYR